MRTWQQGNSDWSLETAPATVSPRTSLPNCSWTGADQYDSDPHGCYMAMQTGRGGMTHEAVPPLGLA